MLFTRQMRWEGFEDETLRFQQYKVGPHRYIPANDWLEEHIVVEEWSSNIPDLSQLKPYGRSCKMSLKKYVGDCRQVMMFGENQY